MKFSWMALVAAVSPLVARAYYTEDQLAAISAGEHPDRTEKYIQNMHPVPHGHSLVAGTSGPVWTATADSAQSGYPASNAVDGNASTFWMSQSTSFPHTITIDMGQNYWVQGVTYLPRQDGQLLGTIGSHQIYLSTNGQNYGKPAEYGLWYDDNTLKVANFSVTQARYIKVVALSESGNRGPVTSAADINIYSVPSNPIYNVSTMGAYGPTLNFPTILVASAVIHTTGGVLGWSSYLWDQFTPAAPHGTTWTTQWNPQTQTVSEAIVSNTQHDMFCPGISRDSQGRVVVSGGNNNYATSMWDDNSQSWTALANLTTPRGYNGQATLSDGRIFTIGGSFSGGIYLKNGEIYSPTTNNWTALPGCLVQPMLTNDAAGLYRSDNHAWLFGWKNNTVLQAGPSHNMNWYTMTNGGGYKSAGTRGSVDQMNGNAVMIDAVLGQILTVGGSPSYDNSTASAQANMLIVGAPNATVQVNSLPNMHYARAFANSVVLPNAMVFIVGGQSFADPFTDTTPQMVPELFSPYTNSFTTLAPIAAIRNYHSTALLLPDASVLLGGGGLCGNCSTNKFDAQIYYPPYFYNSNGGPSTRPVITSISATTLAPGQTITISTSMGITRFALIRYGSATHALNTDQRRVPMEPTSIGTNKYQVTVPNDNGIVIPGAYMLFAVFTGVPSVATNVMIT